MIRGVRLQYRHIFLPSRHMSYINTKFTTRLNIRTPVCAPPMSGASGGALAAAVTAGGGFGFLSGSPTVEHLSKELKLARSILKIDDKTPLPIGVGFLCWYLESPGTRAEELLNLTLENNVQAVWFACGRNIPHWIQLVRDHDRQSRKNTLVFAQINTVDEARAAIQDWNVDILVAQGIESGGHGHGSAPPLLTLVPEILSVIPPDGPPLLAAGGLASGAHVASLLALGASGVVLGTRFLLSPESLYTDAQRNALVRAKNNSTVRTMAFDHARGSLEWPEGVDARGLRNATVDDFDAGIDKAILESKFKEGIRNADPDRFLVWAGTGVTLMSEVKPAKDIVEELHRECEDRLKIFQRGIITPDLNHQPRL